MTRIRTEPTLRKRELFAACSYRPHPGQELVHRSKASRRVLACGVRWGKSTCAAMEAVAALLEPRDRALGWIVAPTYDAARRIFDEVVRTLQRNFSHRVLRYDARMHAITIVNFGGGHSTLRGKSADNPVSLLSEALDFVVIDEAARMKAEVWEQHLSQRLIDRAGWALLLSTPRGLGWFRKLYKRGQNGNDADFESWSSPSWTNPFVSKDLIEAERARMTKDAFDQEFGGMFVGEELEPCDRCGYPSRTASCVVILQGEDDQLTPCIDCGRPCHANGATACMPGVDGKPTTTIIELRKRRTDVPPLPGSERDCRVMRITGADIPDPPPALPD